MAEIFRIGEMDWTDLGGGHLDKAMVRDERTGMLVNVSYYPKGYRMGPHRHTCAHGIYVIDRELWTDQGVVRQGEFVWHRAGEPMDHGATDACGCTFLFITNAPFDIERLPEEGSEP